MDAVQERDHDSGLGEADAEDGGAEFEGDGWFLLCVIPDDELEGRYECLLCTCIPEPKGWLRVLCSVEIWGFVLRRQWRGSSTGRAFQQDRCLH